MVMESPPTGAVPSEAHSVVKGVNKATDIASRLSELVISAFSKRVIAELFRLTQLSQHANV
jgi:hypothetical protein